MPSSFNRPRGLKDTTCRHSECPNRVTPPCSYRASLENLRDCGPGSRLIGYEAIDSLKNVRKTPKGSQGKRGLGANGQEWWCLKCLEAIFVDLRERLLNHMPDGSTPPVHPLTTIQYWIIPERRTIASFDGVYYTLRSPQIYVLAKWQAVKTFDQLRDRPAEGCFDLPEEPADGVNNLYLGHDGESFYMDRAVRDMRGVLADQRICEIDASDVRGYSLSEALRRVDKKEDRMVEEKWKPIMAERNKRLKPEPEAEDHQNVEGQVPTAVEQQEDESMPIELEQPANSLAPIFGQNRHTIPVIYVGNDLPEASTKRKRGNLGQSQEAVRRRPFAPKTPTTALGRPMGTAAKVTERSSAVAHVPSSPLGTVERPSSKIKRSVISTSEDGQSIPIFENTNGASLPLNPTEVTPSLTPSVQPPPRLKFAPKRTSKLYKGRRSIPNANETTEQKKEHGGT